ncbi:hypothetical protein FHS31_000757 [Sphingomonas vulcanisoli]|uniref:Uncharacterized protein n=1 Tax=Sphingomonas vulcanisoli TaxID=1658060 RepID=A0ABX0TRL5_9SPHN|nr:hypothetical protein [Sphingomonas vulcanisoli]NIJ07175.1 hypothetical protein [Sphingomonas vulcanisoli]
MVLLALALASASLHPGIWGDVVAARQSGDYGGIELRIAVADARTIDLAVCEGGCSVFHPAIRRTADGFTFDLTRRMQDGLPPRHCAARFEGDRLVVRWLGEGRVDRLRRLRRPHALAPGAPHDIPALG